MRDIAYAKNGQPGFRLWKIFDQIRTAEAKGNHRFANFKNLGRKHRLLSWNVHIAFAIADAHKKRQDSGDVVGNPAGGNFKVSAFTNRVSARSVVTESKRVRNSRSRSSPGYGSGSA